MFSRRTLLANVASSALIGACAHQPPTQRRAREHATVEPFPLERVRLKASPFLDALNANRDYLHRLDPDRLLHNFRLYAGLRPKGEPYGGWEADTIAGHSLGHYLSACALMHAHTGDEESRTRALYIVAELAECQAAGGDGYVAGFTRTGPDGQTIESGRRVFEEVAAGDIRPSRFYLNGSWAPLYNWHKLLAGLFAAQTHCGADEALLIASRLCGYIEGKLGALNDAAIQQVLSCEHGGLNEMFAELHARTGDVRWRVMAEKIYHRAVLDPLTQQRDELAFNHANTQIPKVIGLARLHALTGTPHYRSAASFFWNAVTRTRTYVIGGNSDREYFQEPNSLSKYITEQTCESCNTYNMMKLTRALYAQEPSAFYFDYYERAHLNHIMAQHRPRDGAFAYMIPLMSGSAREWSLPFDSFWCCVGTGMESHAKHGESIYWRGRDTLYVNLYIPSELDWAERGARLSLVTRYPYEDRVQLSLDSLTHPQAFAIALRAPAWCVAPTVRINGRDTPVAPDEDGYLVMRRTWRMGDRIELHLPLQVRIEATPDNSDTVALLYGPLVLAADVGAAAEPYTGIDGALDPALVAVDVLAAIEPVAVEQARFRSNGAGRPRDLTFAPFYAQYDRRTAVYFKRYSPAQWSEAQTEAAQEAARQAELDRRSIDVARLGEEADEARHRLTSAISYPVSYRRRTGRDARTDGFFEFDMSLEGRARADALALRCAYWGGERERHFHVLVNGTRIATQRLDGEHSGRFVEVDYSIPPELLAGRRTIRVRVEPAQASRAGPMFGARLFRIS